MEVVAISKQNSDIYTGVDLCFCVATKTYRYFRFKNQLRPFKQKTLLTDEKETLTFKRQMELKLAFELFHPGSCYHIKSCRYDLRKHQY